MRALNAFIPFIDEKKDLRAVWFTRVPNQDAGNAAHLKAVRFSRGHTTSTAGWTIMHFTRPPLILTPNLSVNCSAIQMFDACDGLQGPRNIHLVTRLRAMWFTRALKRHGKPSRIYVSLKAARFTGDLKLTLIHGCNVHRLRAMRFTMVLERKILAMGCAVSLSAVWFTRILNGCGRHTYVTNCLRAVRFTLGLQAPSSPTAS